ncbi:MAG: hypothetical protein RLY61_760 [Candidatus Parcubacteria bacterium]|jgi:phosphoglycerate dehydrogenase-like enzyme/predicted transcriptional regulator
MIDTVLLEYIILNPHCRMADIQRHLGHSRTTLLYKLTKLLNAKLIIKAYEGNAAIYLPAEKTNIENYFNLHIDKTIKTQKQLLSKYKLTELRADRTKPKLVFINYYDLLPSHYEELKAVYEITNYSNKELFISPEEFVYRGQDAEVIVNNWACDVTKSLIDQLPKLKYMHVSTHMYRYVDLKALDEKGIHFSHLQAPDYRIHALSEYAIAQTFALLRKVAVTASQLRSGVMEFKQFTGDELRGKVAGIIGTDAVSKELYYFLKNLGTEVYVHSDNAITHPHDWGLSKFTPLKSLVEQSDILYLANSEDTPPKICERLDSKLLGLIKKPIYLISITKHKYIDTKLVKKLIYNGKLKGLALDYFEDMHKIQELTDSDIRTITYLPNVLITPDIAWSTQTSIENMNIATNKYLMAYAKGDYSCLLF